MKKLLLAIVTSTLLFTLTILAIAGVSCKQAEPSPQMTAIEVCQYANQMLPDEYEYQIPTLRYAFSYSALSAQYLGQVAEGEEVRDDELTRSIKELSPRQLRLYKQRLRQRIKDLNPQDREAVLARIRSIPGLRGIVVEFGDTYYLVGKSVWQVSVKVTEEYQRLYEGQWILYPGESSRSYNMQYFLDEATGELTRM